MKELYFFNNIKNNGGLKFNTHNSYAIIKEDEDFFWVEDEQNKLASVSKLLCNLTYTIEETENETTFY